MYFFQIKCILVVLSIGVQGKSSSRQIDLKWKPSGYIHAAIVPMLFSLPKNCFELLLKIN